MIRLRDAKLPEGRPVENDQIVHAEYVVRLVNELRVAGAKGIAISDTRYTERVTAWTKLVCWGSTIRVGNRNMKLPLEVLAVGEQTLLRQAIYRPDSTYMECKRKYDLPWNAFPRTTIRLPATKPPSVISQNGSAST